MKNKGRKHIVGIDNKNGAMNCKGLLTHLTRPIESMSSKGKAGSFNPNSAKFYKRKWQKRVRGYWRNEVRNYIQNYIQNYDD